jgi:hypothetical protein
MLCQLCLLARSLNVLLPQPIRLVDAGLDFGLNSQRQLEVERSQRLDQEIANGGIQRFAMYSLADGLGVLDRSAHTRGGRHFALFVYVVAYRHPVATTTADHQALQKRWSFSGWARTPIDAIAVSRLAQLLKVLLVLLPRDIAGAGSMR